MDVLVAKHAGYCWGVVRALRVADEAHARAGGPVHTLGPLIHNATVVEDLRDRGIVAVEDFEMVGAGGTLIVRAHGTTPERIAEAEARGIAVVDGTCPFVKRTQELARQLVEEGYHLVVIGKRDHPETIGIVGHAGGHASIVQYPEDVDQVPRVRRIGVVMQSTQEEKKLAEIVLPLLGRCKDLRIFNTICNEITRRQLATEELAKAVDVMLVVGGRNSANTKSLVTICEEVGVATHHVERPVELRAEWLAGNERVGIAAGASTPDTLLDSMIERVTELEGSCA